MSTGPELPLPEDQWKNLWEFSVNNLTEDERAQIDQAYETMKNATEALFDLHAMLGGKDSELSKDVRDFVEEISKTNREMMGTFQNLIKMSTDPYKVQRDQLKKRNRLKG